MKFLAAAPLLAAANAFVVPDASVFEVFAANEPQGSSSLPKDAVIHQAAVNFDKSIREAQQYPEGDLDRLLSATPAEDETPFGISDLHPPHHGREHNFNATIYELISKSNHTTFFAKYVSKYKDIVELLNSTKANHTLFIPTDEAIKKLPEKEYSDEFIRNAIFYHIGLGRYSTKEILTTHTLPTALKEPFLGDNAQRLRTRAGFFGVRVNFYSKVIAANFGATNGIIHAVDHVLLPPTFIGKELSFFPSKFSTLLLAYEKTDFVSYIHNVKMLGSTVFAPSNTAWTKLGPRANAFLFNTDKGKHFLSALLKYQIVANETLYSDALYESGSGVSGADSVDMEGLERYHVDLPSLLGDKSISVDVKRWGGLIRVILNGHVHVAVQDFLGKNGNVHVINSVLVPPRKPGNKVYEDADEEIDVEDLIARLAPFVGEEAAPSGTQEPLSDL